jgi:competence ComEA-like helix-hairpin-helix protein
LENLALVNINSSPAEELAWVLGVRDDVAEAIIARRERQPFAKIAQLRAISGVDAAKLEQRKSRILLTGKQSGKDKCRRRGANIAPSPR